MEFGIQSIMNFFTASIVASMVVVIFLGSKKQEARAFTFFIFLVVAWITSHGFFHSVTDQETAYFFIRLNFFLGSLIGVSFFYFVFTFLHGRYPSLYFILPMVGTAVLFFVLFFFPSTSHLIISGVEPHTGLQGWLWLKGSLWFVFDLFFFSFWTAGLVLLYLKYRRSADNERARSLYMFFATSVAIIPTSLMNIILPDFGYYALDWLGTITSLGWVCVLGYSIVKYNQMNVRVVLTEVLVLAAILILFINIFV